MRKQILIIGGSSGIGLSLTREAIASGHQVTTISRNDMELVGQGNHRHFQADITSEEVSFPQIDGPIHAMVYCPGSINLKPFKGLKPEAFLEDLQINLLGLVKTLHYYMNNLQMSDQSSIVLFSTVAVATGMPFHTSVAAAKGAVEGFARSLAAELAPKIRVNVIAPSLTQTPMSERLLKNDRQNEASNERHPLKRFGQPGDISKMAGFLISDDSSWITGQVMHVDGGLSTLRIS